jgi:hypothetical protein
LPSRRCRVSVPSRRVAVSVVSASHRHRESVTSALPSRRRRVNLESRWRRVAVASFIACRRIGIASLSRVDLASRWRRLSILCCRRLVSRRRLVAVASASRRLSLTRCEVFASASLWHRLGIAPLQASRRRRVGVTDAKPSRRLSRCVGVKSFFACRHVGIASLSCTDLAKASLRHHRNVVIASPSCRRRIVAVKPSRYRPVPLRRRRVDHESRRRCLAVASVSRLFCVP